MNQKQIEILKDLDWKSTPDRKKAGFIAALQETDHQYLILPADYCGSWDDCAIVFLILSDDEIEPYLFDMLAWLQDLNWSGAKWILDRLERVSSELLREPLERAAKLASDQNDDKWLGSISILIANPNMVYILEEDVLEMLKPYAVEHWSWDYDKIAKHFNLK